MEVLELVAPALGHQTKDENCPFCKDEEKPDVETYPGKDNHSPTLGANLKAGTNGRRKQDKKCRKHAPLAKKLKPKFVVDKAPFTSYSFQAHHAISGNQAMKEHPVEKWIWKEKGTIAADTGYSINNSANGVWLPSKPSKKSWDGDFPDTADRRRIAYFAMAKRRAQWHLGHHAIDPPAESEIRNSLEAQAAYRDSVARGSGAWTVRTSTELPPEDTSEETDDADAEPGKKGKYDSWLKEQLGLIDLHISDVCKPRCQDTDQDDDGKPYMNTVVHAMIDQLSGIAQRKLENPRVWKKWNVFISLLAWEYTVLKDDVDNRPRRRRVLPP